MRYYLFNFYAEGRLVSQAVGQGEDAARAFSGGCPAEFADWADTAGNTIEIVRMPRTN